MICSFQDQFIYDIVWGNYTLKKTDNGRLITGYACDRRIADAEFLLTKRQYIAAAGRVHGSDDVITCHVCRSFRPGKMIPEEANRLGVEFTRHFTQGKELQTEYAKLLEEKKKTYAEYRRSCEEKCGGILCSAGRCVLTPALLVCSIVNS